VTSNGTRRTEPAKEPPGDLTSIRFTIGGEAALVGADTDDPGTMDWWGSATISEWPFDDEDRLDPEKLKQSGVALSTEDVGDGGLKMTILAAHGLMIDLWRVQNIYDALDARSEDYANFIPMFGERGHYGELGLVEELEDSLEPGGNQVVILDRVRLAPAWRGCGSVGRLLTIHLLRWLCDDPRAVVLKPFPIDLDDDQKQDKAVFRKAMTSVRRTWKSIGFEPFSDDIWVLDPRTGSYDRTVKRLSKRLGLPH
jgi:hypothetical protein